MRGSVTEPGVVAICSAKPAVSTASKRMPASVIDAISSRESLARCTGVRSRSSPAVLRSSSATIWPGPTRPVSSVSGLMIRRVEAVLSFSMRSRVRRSSTASVMLLRVMLLPVTVKASLVTRCRGPRRAVPPS
jgi:hypothetical protein